MEQSARAAKVKTSYIEQGTDLRTTQSLRSPVPLEPSAVTVFVLEIAFAWWPQTTT